MSSGAMSANSVIQQDGNRMKRRRLAAGNGIVRAQVTVEGTGPGALPLGAATDISRSPYPWDGDSLGSILLCSEKNLLTFCFISP